MARLIGMDEAGLGPNLGPLVIAVTVWDVEAPPRTVDFWQTFREVLTNQPNDADPRLHIADSKQVFQPHRSIAPLERGVLAALRLIGQNPRTFTELCEYLTDQRRVREGSNEANRWYDDGPCELPFEDHDFSIVTSWKRCCEESKVQLVAIRAAIVEPMQFNQLIDQHGNKALVVSRIAFQLLKSVWKPDETPTFIVGDKHGGRNRYDELLSEIVDEEMIFRLEEGAEKSEYRVGQTVLRFQPRAEEHGPVALASMTAKYVRELAMSQFNRYWISKIDGLKPTQGYPVDAKRFREQIGETQRQLGISDDVLWRCR